MPLVARKRTLVTYTKGKPTSHEPLILLLPSLITITICILAGIYHRDVLPRGIVIYSRCTRVTHLALIVNADSSLEEATDAHWHSTLLYSTLLYSVYHTYAT